MDTQKICNTFPRCSVIFSDDLIIVSFGSGVSQSVWRGEPQQVFVSLLDSCKLFRIYMNPQDGFRLIFEFDRMVCSGTVYYQPIEREKTREEILKIINDAQPEKLDIDFASFFDGVPIDDEAAVLQGFLEFLEARDKSEDSGVSSLMAARRWDLIDKESNSFLNNVKVFDDIEYIPPDRYSNGVGSITLSCFSRKARTILFDSGLKAQLLKLVKLSDGVDFDCWISKRHGAEAVFQIIIGTERG